MAVEKHCHRGTGSLISKAISSGTGETKYSSIKSEEILQDHNFSHHTLKGRVEMVDEFLGCVTNSTEKNRWHMKLWPAQEQVTFSIDTRAEVTCIPGELIHGTHGKGISIRSDSVCSWRRTTPNNRLLKTELEKSQQICYDQNLPC